MAHEIPNHVKKYLVDNDVNPDDLGEEAKETLADLNEEEVEVLKKVGKGLKYEDTSVIARIH